MQCVKQEVGNCAFSRFTLGLKASKAFQYLSTNHTANSTFDKKDKLLIRINRVFTPLRPPFNSFMTEVPIILINSANQWTGFYMIGTPFMKELNIYMLSAIRLPPTNNSGPLSTVQPHSPNVDHCVFTIFEPKVPEKLVTRLAP